MGSGGTGRRYVVSWGAGLCAFALLSAAGHAAPPAAPGDSHRGIGVSEFTSRLGTGTASVPGMPEDIQHRPVPVAKSAEEPATSSE